MSDMQKVVIIGASIALAAYIGTKVVNAKPMTRQQYLDLRGWELPADEDGTDEGYLVEYTDGGKPCHPDFAGYISWSPKDVFERSYSELAQSAQMESTIIHQDNNGVVVHHITQIDEHELAAGHNYDILLPGVNPPANLIAVRFQHGPVKEVGVNGVTNEALLAILIHRTKALNDNFPCDENNRAITYMENALALFEQRTKNRQARGVEGKLEV